MIKESRMIEAMMLEVSISNLDFNLEHFKSRICAGIFYYMEPTAMLLSTFKLQVELNMDSQGTDFVDSSE